MFLGNNPAGRQQLPAPIPCSTLLGFPGIGGTLRDDSVGYLRLRRQPTTLETGGGHVVVQFAATLKRAGFPVVRSPDMDGWLAYHAVLVACICAALYRLDGDAAALADDRPALTLMCRSIEEGFSALAHGGTTGLPHNLHVLHRPLLRPVAVRYWAHTLRSPIGECCFAAHARHAEPEMRALALDVIQRAAAMPDTDHLRALLG